MKRIIKTFIMLLIWGAGVPSLAAYAIMTLWNAFVPAISGFASVSFTQSLGIFFLSQLLSGGFIIGLFLLGACLHHLRPGHDHWHNLSPDERREFWEHRRQWHNMTANPQDER